MIQPGELAAELRVATGKLARVFAAPGRVNLIGEHTDYNDGFVMPFAIERGTLVAASPRADRKIIARSRSVDGISEIDLSRESSPRGSWSDYVEGVARSLERRGHAVSGADLLVDSDVPSGAGLSSSAALEIAVGLALTTLAGTSVARQELALAGQEAEHRWVGTLCGIMDQMVVACGVRDQALLIDCRSLETRAVPLALGDHVILVCDSRVKHDLASSDYNTRRRECEQGAELLQIRSLREIGVDELAVRDHVLPELIRRRCRHVVTETQRTLDAAAALAAGQRAKVGALMNASHASLRDDFEVSCAELDVLAAVAQEHPGVLGARMTGGGFGGCTVNLVAAAQVPSLEEALTTAYRQRFGRAPVMFVTRAVDGAREVT